MTNTNRIAEGTRKKVRYKVENKDKTKPSGFWSIEELWDADLESLNKLTVDLYVQLQSSTQITFLKKPNPNDALTQLKFDIAKYILETRVEEEEAAKERAKTRAEKLQRAQNIQRMVYEKENQELASRATEELKAELATLTAELKDL